MKSRSSLMEIALSVLVVVLLVGGLAAFTRTWPPAVIVESGSMMHPDDDVPYGRTGTIDPGDIVIVKRAASREDVALAVDGGRARYGAPGDVVVFLKNGDPVETPIIHRVITYVEVLGEGEGRTYRVRWDGSWREFGSEGILLPELGFDGNNPCCSDGRYRPQWSGFVTKGDNGKTNRASDQALLISPQPVPFEWVKGEARGEIPWIGLVKLALAPSLNAYDDGWMRVGNAYAPHDLWTMLAVSVGAFLAAPIAWDAARRRLWPRA